MTLFKLKACSCLLIEDDYNTNILPMVTELADNTESTIKIFSYEQPEHVWLNVFEGKTVQFFKGFTRDECESTKEKLICFIDSINQMVIDIGWNECLKNLRYLENNPNVIKSIIILHSDCLLPSSKLRTNLNHIANAIITYDSSSLSKICIQIKKNGKIFKSEENLSYDSKTSTLKLTAIVKDNKKVEEPEKVMPSNLSTFKIETDQTQQLEKHKLKLPYMSKINEGQGKVYYEPDAVDDWDDEDPDDDLDI